jgi:hypothetical protein
MLIYSRARGKSEPFAYDAKEQPAGADFSTVRASAGFLPNAATNTPMVASSNTVSILNYGRFTTAVKTDRIMTPELELDTGPPKVRPGRRNPRAQNCQLAIDRFSLTPAECERKQFVAPETSAHESDLRWLQLKALTLDRDDDVAQIARADLSKEFPSSY